MFGRLAMGFANVRAGTRVLMLVLVQALAGVAALLTRSPSLNTTAASAGEAAARPAAPAPAPALVLEYPPEH